MRKIFYPGSIVIAGVSAEKERPANAIINNLLELNYKGNIYGLGKNTGQISGIPIYTSLLEIKEKIDLIVIMVPAKDVPGLLADAGRQGIDRAVVITAGFNELGGAGDELAKQITEIAEKYFIRFIGPNCQGVVCTNSGVCVPFAPLSQEQAKCGSVSLVAQSGSVGWSGAVILSNEINGISKIASIGNKLNVNENDLLEYMIEDPDSDVLVFYLESFSNGRKFFEIARNSIKPVIVLKSNTSGNKSKLALSHTGAIASDDRIVDAAMKQAGIMRAYGLREMIEMCKAFVLPPMKGNNIVIFAASGGMGILGEDMARRKGLNLPELPGELMQKITEKGDWKIFNLTNPVDIGGFFDNSHLIDMLDNVLSIENIDGVVMSVFNEGPYQYPYDSSKMADHVALVSKKHNKPVALHFAADLTLISDIKKEKDFPQFETIEDAVAALATLFEYNKIRNKPHSLYIKEMKNEWHACQELLAKNKFCNSDAMAMELVSEFGIECELPLKASDFDDAEKKADDIGYPVVMKIFSPDITHKTDAGGVITDIRNKPELEKAYHEIMENIKKHDKSARINGVTIQRMLPESPELLIGGKHDENFGPYIVFGMGGIYVEILNDVSIRLAPVSHDVALEMINETRAGALLKGFRGGESYDIDALADLIERFSIFMACFTSPVEIELNPVKIMDRNRFIAVDGRFRFLNR